MLTRGIHEKNQEALARLRKEHEIEFRQLNKAHVSATCHVVVIVVLCRRKH